LQSSFLPFENIGSTHNSIVIHIVLVLSLFQFLKDNSRPHLNFIFIDSPASGLSQDNRDSIGQDDSRKLREIYRNLIEFSKRTKVQVIIVDHTVDPEVHDLVNVAAKFTDGSGLVPNQWKENSQ